MEFILGKVRSFRMDPVPFRVGVKREFRSFGPAEIEKRRERRIWEEKEGGKMRENERERELKWEVGKGGINVKDGLSL